MSGEWLANTRVNAMSKAAEFRKKIYETKANYAEGQYYWSEFWLNGIPYRVSSEGVVQTRLNPNKKRSRTLEGWRPKAIAKARSDNHGGWYYAVNFQGKWQLKLHQLMATCFLGLTEPGQEINHINGNRADNRISNLEICSRKENARNAANRGAFSKPNFKGKLKEQDIIEICKLLNIGVMNKDIAEKFGVCRTTISSIRNRRSFKSLTAEYLSIHVGVR